MTTYAPAADRRAPFRTAASSAVPVRPIPTWWRDLSVCVAWGLGVFVVALWVMGGGITGMSDTAGILNETGRLTGLLASYLLLLQVFLMARMPFVEQAFGQDKLTRIHRVVGFSSFTLMLGHIGLITLGYAADGPNGLWGTIVDLTLNYPGMLLAIAGTLAIFMVVFTSFKAARRKLRYESWHLIHLYAYLGVGLALPHQLWTGRDFLASPLATTFWWGLYGAVALSVIVFRIGLPLARTQRAGLRVTDVRIENPGTVSVTMSGRGAHRLGTQAGQFFQWRFLDGEGSTRANPYSLSAAPRVNARGETELRITAAMVGEGSQRLATLQPGTRVMVEGPYGRMHAGAATQRKSLLLGAGIGIAPMRALLESLPGERGDITVVQRHSNDVDLVLDREIEQLAAARGADYYVLRGHRVHGRRSWLPEQYADLSDAEGLLRACPDVAERDVYVCGAPGWMDAVEAALHAAGVPNSQIHIEHFSY